MGQIKEYLRRSRKKGRRAVLIAIAGVMLAPTGTVLAGETVYVNCDVLRCRSTAEITDGNIISNLHYGEKLERVGSSGEWTMVLVNGRKCYVSSAYLTTKDPKGQAAGTAGSANSKGAASGQETQADDQKREQISLSQSWKYAEFSKINTGAASLYRTKAANKKNKTVCVNAGHGTSGGSSVKTQCHPDGTPKVTGGTTQAGAINAVAVSSGMTFADGTPESRVTLSMAKVLRDRLLAEGYDVLMIRESDDVQLDNIARTVIANNRADCHIALHWDSTSTDKGAFYMSVPNNSSYRAMEPVASHWQDHHRLGDALVGGLRNAGVKIFSGGSMAMDLTQTSYSTVPSVDIELGDKVSDHSAETLARLAEGLTAGVNAFFGD